MGDTALPALEDCVDLDYNTLQEVLGCTYHTNLEVLSQEKEEYLKEIDDRMAEMNKFMVIISQLCFIVKYHVKLTYFYQIIMFPYRLKSVASRMTSAVNRSSLGKGCKQMTKILCYANTVT